MQNRPLENLCGKYLLALELRLAVAESCTGGLLSHRITNVPGSSAYFAGGVVTYANQAKERLLGVPVNLLEQHGAVSQEVALAMASGIYRLLNADIGVSITGIAGPGGGTKEKPVGLVWIAICTPDFAQAWKFMWKGDRLTNKELSAEKALELLVEYLRNRQTMLARSIQATGQG